MLPVLHSCYRYFGVGGFVGWLVLCGIIVIEGMNFDGFVGCGKLFKDRDEQLVTNFIDFHLNQLHQRLNSYLLLLMKYDFGRNRGVKMGLIKSYIIRSIINWFKFINHPILFLHQTDHHFIIFHFHFKNLNYLH